MTDDNDPQVHPQVQFGDQSLHLAFEQQIKEMLDRADLTEEQRQQILMALQCPCCGSGGVSVTVKLKS
ncbi:MAG TPA: hypothetical protein VMU87_17975 [Stellaceae bacterium]|nr:hypothetical protein [Stellaceae bacterium]